jgi:pimeloyl-ACP methyl ester carboxylesterase
MKKSKILLSIFLVLTSIGTITAQQLPRIGWFGAKTELITNENYQQYALQEVSGIAIKQVVGGTAASMKLLAEDVILSIDRQKFTEIAALGKYINSKKEEETLAITVSRKGKKINLKGLVKGRDRETDQKSEVIYESVAFRNGKLNVIINKPRKEGKLPALLFIPGYTCSSIDNLPENHPYGRVIRAFSDAGYVVVRVEKSGLGDSQNTPDCASTTLYDEVESFQAGLDKLKSLDYVDFNNIFVFGHSMGGIIAPALSAKNNLKGVMVYGTTAKSWFEYQLEMNRLQLMLAKPDPIEYENSCRIQAEIAHEYFIQKKSLQDIALNPEKAEVLKRDWQYDGKSMIFDRNQEYWRQIQDYPLLDNWKKTNAKVLVIYGGADYQAFSKADHEQIVYTVNHFHPNHAELLIFPQTDHYLAKSETMQNAFDLFNARKYQELFNSFDFDVTLKSVEWANKQLIKN